jgi:hypothetical protein
MASSLTSNISLLYFSFPARVSFFFRKALRFLVGLTRRVFRPFAGLITRPVNWTARVENVGGASCPAEPVRLHAFRPVARDETESRRPQSPLPFRSPSP